MAGAPRDVNREVAALLTSNAGDRTTHDWWIDPTTHRALVNTTGTVTALPDKTATATLANVATSTSNATLLANNASRKVAIVVNDSTSVLYVKYGTTASSTSYTARLEPYETLIEENYTGKIDGILVSGSGNARTTEL